MVPKGVFSVLNWSLSVSNVVILVFNEVPEMTIVFNGFNLGFPGSEQRFSGLECGYIGFRLSFWGFKLKYGGS